MRVQRIKVSKVCRKLQEKRVRESKRDDFENARERNKDHKLQIADRKKVGSFSTRHRQKAENCHTERASREKLLATSISPGNKSDGIGYSD